MQQSGQRGLVKNEQPKKECGPSCHDAGLQKSEDHRILEWLEKKMVHCQHGEENNSKDSGDQAGDHPLAEDAEIHQQQFKIEHRPQYHEGQLCAWRNQSSKTSGDESISLAAEIKHHRHCHHQEDCLPRAGEQLVEGLQWHHAADKGGDKGADYQVVADTEEIVRGVLQGMAQSCPQTKLLAIEAAMIMAATGWGIRSGIASQGVVAVEPAAEQQADRYRSNQISASQTQGYRLPDKAVGHGGGSRQPTG